MSLSYKVKSIFWNPEKRELSICYIKNKKRHKDIIRIPKESQNFVTQQSIYEPRKLPYHE